MYDRILLPTDGAEIARPAIREAVGLAELTGATVHALYVLDTRDYSTLPETKWLTVREELEAEGERALDAVAAEAESAGVAVETTLTRGIPHEEILDYAENHGVNVVVMATHGRSGMGRFLLGSVTEKVIRSATVPVLVVHVDED